MFLARYAAQQQLTRVFCASQPRVLLRFFSFQTNPPLNLDSTFSAVLGEGDMSLAKGSIGKQVKELEIISESQYSSQEGFDADGHDDYTSKRKSPAAHYGSRQIGAVILPNQLQNAINTLISDSDKVQLHSDAKRLFYDEGDTEVEGEWKTEFDPNGYRSRKQAHRHSDRDGTAFATVALPAHYSAILAVFNHIKQRLEPSWKVERIINWGAGTGSGIWAALHTFQSPQGTQAVENKLVADSTVVSYTGIDKRDGLVSIAKRLFQGVDLGSVSLTWQKSFKEEDKIKRTDGHDTVALSSFLLTSLPTAQHRKAHIKEMWESGAHVMVLIDHGTDAGFEAIAESREYLLSMGRRELEDVETEGWPVRGSHVVAPRLQRPSFVRKTKHSGVGHEDIDYSYVVIRRGQRPTPSLTNVGRVGAVARRELQKQALTSAPITELRLESECTSLGEAHTQAKATDTLQKNDAVVEEDLSPEELEEALRLESYIWPRLVFSPIKNSGHILLDSCTAEAKIMRLTIPKSQGKQAFYDARKASWGDLFPHAPKNAPQERYQPTRAKREGGTTPVRGSDIGKRKREHKIVRYETLAKDLKADLKADRMKSRRDHRH
ncbi:hypothetical protein H0H93_005767 [Arthromyces matolae]|nr:hypothetical protein H0H93_005767 [Arthromyces matolae]